LIFDLLGSGKYLLQFRTKEKYMKLSLHLGMKFDSLVVLNPCCENKFFLLSVQGIDFNKEI